jgi:uncharacterized protein YbjT (DUF2867 family)
MSCRRVTVFGGTGFLGRRNVRHLQNTDFAGGHELKTLYSTGPYRSAADEGKL